MDYKQQYNQIVDFISKAQFKLKPEWEFDPVSLAHHVKLVFGLLEEELASQRQYAAHLEAIIFGLETSKDPEMLKLAHESAERLVLSKLRTDEKE